MRLTLLLLKWRVFVFFLHGLQSMIWRSFNLIVRPPFFMLNSGTKSMLGLSLALLSLVLRRFFVYLRPLSAYMQNVGCTNADWALDTKDRKSISGYSFYFQGSLVSWSAIKQKSIALSSTEAEYYVMTHAFKQVLWLRTFLMVLKFPFLILSLSSVTTKLLAPFLIPLQSRLALNTLTFVIISFGTTCKMVLFLLHGYVLRICWLIYLPRLFRFLFFLVTVMFLVYQSLLLYLSTVFCSFFFFFLFIILMGVC